MDVRERPVWAIWARSRCSSLLFHHAAAWIWWDELRVAQIQFLTISSSQRKRFCDNRRDASGLKIRTRTVRGKRTDSSNPLCSLNSLLFYLFIFFIPVVFKVQNLYQNLHTSIFKDYIYFIKKSLLLLTDKQQGSAKLQWINKTRNQESDL